MIIDATTQKVLNKIADALVVDPETLFIENGHVFFHGSDGSLGCACSIDTDYWHELLAEVKTVELLRRLMNWY